MALCSRAWRDPGAGGLRAGHGAGLILDVGGPDGRTRVLYVINDLAWAGAETQLVALACALPTERYEARIVLLKERNDFADVLARASIPVVALHRTSPADLGVGFRLARALFEGATGPS